MRIVPRLKQQVHALPVLQVASRESILDHVQGLYPNKMAGVLAGRKNYIP
jgi:hypothetical protein